MPSRKGIVGMVLVGVLGVLALLPGSQDPAAMVDPPTSRYRPPGTRLVEVQLADGSTLLAESVEQRGTDVVLLRRGSERSVPAAEIVNWSEAGLADSRLFLLGTDKLGRDMWSRILAGARVSLKIGLLSVVLALLVGVVVGAAAAMSTPAVDNLLMRGVDALLAFPRLFLLIALAALFTPSTATVILFLGATSWMSVCRLARGELLSLKSQDFVLASRGLGQTAGRIVVKHLLPNALTPLVVEASLLVGDMILAEAALSYFGFGVPEPTPSWGAMVSAGRETLGGNWWTWVFPGLAIALTVVGFNLLGDGLRDRLDPQHGEASARP